MLIEIMLKLFRLVPHPAWVFGKPSRGQDSQEPGRRWRTVFGNGEREEADR